MIEREIKLRIKNLTLDEISEKLILDKIEFLGEEKETDIYFNSMNRDFRKTDEVLRIREIDNGKDKELELTYKGPKFGTSSKSREEIIIKIDQGYEDSLIRILEKLGFNVVYKVIKKRKYFRDRNFIICLDDVENLGYFIEIEINNGTEEELLDYVNKFLRKYNIEAEKVDKSYLELLIDRNG